MSREPDETTMHPKSSDGLIKSPPRTRILAANGILSAWHSFAANKARLRSISLPRHLRIFHPLLRRDFPRFFRFPRRIRRRDTIRFSYFERSENEYFRESSRLIALILARGSRVTFTSGSIPRGCSDEMRTLHRDNERNVRERIMAYGFNLLVS